MQSNQSLRDRLAQLSVQIAVLEAERKLIHKKLKTVTYPILTLPFEITSAIFVHCLPDLPDIHPISGFSPERLPIPILLTQVCRAWRAIALKTPKIWATFSLRVDEIWGHEHTTNRSRWLRGWLERAGSSLLSFVLEPRHIRFDKSSGTLPPLLGLMLARANQWQNAHLRLSHEELVEKQLHLDLHGRLHFLEKLGITTNFRGSGTAVITAFELAPSLRSVLLERLSATAILLPWRQLTHFSGKWINDVDCLHVLRSADSLVECKFDGIDGDMDETALLPKNSTLKVLYLHGEAVCCDLLSLLTLPSLVELDYYDIQVRVLFYPDYHEHFVDFMSRSRPPLSHLYLHGGAYSRILNGFPFLPNVTALEISRLTVGKLSEFFQDLRTRDPISFLPNLESIAVSVYQPLQSYRSLPEETSDINYEDLTDALEFRKYRNAAGSQLKSFRMKWAHEEWRETFANAEHARANEILLTPPANLRINLSRLHDLIEDGMHISVIAQVGSKSEVWI